MIEVKNAVKKYRKVQALDNLSLNIEKGKITALLGLNGAGKSTTLKAIMGLVRLSKGEILVDGEKVNYKTYNKIAFVPDVSSHYKEMNIKEAFEFMDVYYKNWDMEKAYTMLKKFKLSDDRKISTLSKGNIARVKLILGFAQNPEYLLLDEPFSGIDVFTREDFISSMISYMSEDMAIAITTHEIDEIEAVADYVYLIENGRVLTEFNVEELRETEGMSIMDKMREVYTGEDKI